MKIAFFEIREGEEDYLKSKLSKHTLTFHKEQLNSTNSADIISIRAFSKIDKSILQKLPNLKLIVIRSTGFDNVDVDECNKKNISVCNVPSYGENTVAEHTFGLILSLSRNINKGNEKVLKGDFSINDLSGFDLKGKTLGILGTGRIGVNVIKIAKAFDMNVLAYDIYQNKMAESLGAKYVLLEEVLKNSDVITLHVPYNEKTHHIINKDTLKQIKKGAILVNTARGALVDTKALIEALDKNISGAGLDVLEEEDEIKQGKKLDLLKKLSSKDNVIITPHIAFYTKEALNRILKTTIENITAFESGNVKNKVELLGK